MGVQIINKDVSLISQIAGKAKANISNIWGVTGWSGGGGTDVTPNVVNWSDPVGTIDEGVWLGGTYVTQQITGINTPITLSVNYDYCDGSLYYKINNTSTIPNGSLPPEQEGFTYATCPTYNSIIVNNNDWLAFGCRCGVGTITPITIKNASDGNTILDTINITG